MYDAVWDCTKEDFVPMPSRMAAFLIDLDDVCYRNGLALGLNRHDELVVEEYKKQFMNGWLSSAAKNYEEQKPTSFT